MKKGAKSKQRKSGNTYIDDAYLISEILKSKSFIQSYENGLRERIGRKSIEHPLDESVMEKLQVLLNNSADDKHNEEAKNISYAKVDELDDLWLLLIKKSVLCLRLFDTREPFGQNPDKTIVAYGLDRLKQYHSKYVEFESQLYGSDSYYRDHVFHVFRVWMLGVYLLLDPLYKNSDKRFVSKLSLDARAKIKGRINMLEYLSMWTIASLCHDLGYPLEKVQKILSQTKDMMLEFVPNSNIWNNFEYSGSQDNINEYILKFISTKMKKAPKPKQGKRRKKKEAYLGRIQPKYYFKYSKSLESFKHGIIGTIIIYKMLLYFIEADFNLNDDYTYDEEEARQFYIRREILRSIASHTCSDAYNVELTTLSSLLFLCDESQEWGRKRWDEIYTGLTKKPTVKLRIKDFSDSVFSIEEVVDFESSKLDDMVKYVDRAFNHQYAKYRMTFRDGQYTADRKFSLKKVMTLNDRDLGVSIQVSFDLPEKARCRFIITAESGDSDYEDQFFNDLKTTLSKSEYWDLYAAEVEGLPIDDLE